jgi:CBS domain-containing protein
MAPPAAPADAFDGGLQHADSAFDMCEGADHDGTAGPAPLPGRTHHHQPQQAASAPAPPCAPSPVVQQQKPSAEQPAAGLLPHPRSMANLIVPAGPAVPLRRPPQRRPSRIIVAASAERSGGPDSGAPRVFVAIPKALAGGGEQPQLLPACELRHATSDGSALTAAAGAAGGRRPPQRRASAIALPSYVRRALRFAPLPGEAIGEAPAEAAQATPPAGEQRSTSADALPAVPNPAAAAAAQLLSSAGAAGWARVPAPAGAASGSNAPLLLVVGGGGDVRAALADDGPSAAGQAAAAAAAVEMAAEQPAKAEEVAEEVAAEEEGESGSSLEEWWCAPPTGLRVADVMAGPPAFIDAAADAATARALMAANGTAVLLVDRGPGLPPGMIEERDLFRVPALLRARAAAARGRRPHGAAGVSVEALMHARVVVVGAGDAVEAAAQALQDADARRAVVRGAGPDGDGAAASGRGVWVGTISEAAIYRCGPGIASTGRMFRDLGG